LIGSLMLMNSFTAKTATRNRKSVQSLSTPRAALSLRLILESLRESLFSKNVGQLDSVWDLLIGILKLLVFFLFFFVRRYKIWYRLQVYPILSSSVKSIILPCTTQVRFGNKYFWVWRNITNTVVWKVVGLYMTFVQVLGRGLLGNLLSSRFDYFDSSFFYMEQFVRRNLPWLAWRTIGNLSRA
jgi:hypothetical protein